MGKVYKQARRDRLAGADVLIVGFFSAKQKDYEAVMEATATLAAALGARVAGLVAQRRGVSDGGVAVMGRPFSRQTLLRPGKVRELAQRCRAERIGAVVFVNALSDRQRLILEARLGCTVVHRGELE